MHISGKRCLEAVESPTLIKGGQPGVDRVILEEELGAEFVAKAYQA